jgi:type II secretory pathway pseudopilin PulG
MYKVIGSDQKEYGPFTPDEIRSWISQGRLTGQSRIQLEGSPTWQNLSELPEFAGALVAQPPLLGTAPAPAPAPVKPKTSGLAIASLVLGALGLLTCGLTSLVGLVLGAVALIKIKKSQGRLSGSGLAIAGICVSGVLVLMLPIMAALLLPALATAKSKAQSIQCMNNVKQLNLAIMMFANDNNEQLPTPSRWCDDIQRYVGGAASVFHCAAQTGHECSYAFNASLADKKLSDVTAPAQTVLVFESNGGSNRAGGPEIAARNHRGDFVCVGFADGHAEIVQAKRLESLRWEP